MYSLADCFSTLLSINENCDYYTKEILNLCHFRCFSEQIC